MYASAGMRGRGDAQFEGSISSRGRRARALLPFSISIYSIIDGSSTGVEKREIV
jgi:hypothetical protein